MDDPNITMEEYIRLEEEKARRHGKVYNWETSTYGRIWDDDEVHNLISVESIFPAIVFDDMFTSQAALSCEPTVSPLNDNEIDFRISFDESDDEDYTAESARQIPDKGDLSAYWVGISSTRDFLGTTLYYTLIRDSMPRLCHRYLRMFASGRKRNAMIYGRQFVAHLTEHFGLLIEERLQGLTMIAPQPPLAAGPQGYGTKDNRWMRIVSWDAETLGKQR
ncbi:hypothetical protein Tco_0664357 [Tanacetum coccineum]